MSIEFHEKFGISKPSLPLSETGKNNLWECMKLIGKIYVQKIFYMKYI